MIGFKATIGAFDAFSTSDVLFLGRKIFGSIAVEAFLIQASSTLAEGANAKQLWIRKSCVLQSFLAIVTAVPDVLFWLGFWSFSDSCRLNGALFNAKMQRSFLREIRECRPTRVMIFSINNSLVVYMLLGILKTLLKGFLLIDTCCLSSVVVRWSASRRLRFVRRSSSRRALVSFVVRRFCRFGALASLVGRRGFVRRLS